MKTIFAIALFSFISAFITGCSDSKNDSPIAPIDTTVKITFLELGSEGCKPCEDMEPVLDSIRKKYGSQILVKFIDVIKNAREAARYKIEAMPTQVFLDTNQQEIHRHVGFYHEDSIHVFLAKCGLKRII